MYPPNERDKVGMGKFGTTEIVSMLFRVTLGCNYLLVLDFPEDWGRHGCRTDFAA